MEKTKLQTIDIKGKKYSTVDARVEFFREKFPAWSLETDYPVLDLDKGVCVCVILQACRSIRNRYCVTNVIIFAAQNRSVIILKYY